MERPLLSLDLSGPDGNVFMVLGHARALFEGEALERFNHDTCEARQPGANKQYKDILEIVNLYVRLVDRSGLYPEYAVDKEAVMTAVQHLNEGIDALPQNVYTAIYGLYPDFDEPDMDENTYLTMLHMEIGSVQAQITQSSTKTPLEQLLTLLRECAEAFTRAGVE